ncbi:hypothetical protein [Methanobrevibacter sp.]|uniref:hypothetical protein n=1 Tax=Methanobrevibacter sp. TaxID=66852 RepID=UPI0025E5C6EC|nr:hypothetical protein [Methanobrevibacter sp.]MBQ6512899.1 hypothetical protein [Methanobrevibacter sp.]
MNLNKKLLTLLAIFCIIASAGIVCAADQGGYAGSNYDMAEADGLEPGNGLPLENQTGYVPLDADGNPILNATGNTTSNITGNATHNATGNVTGNVTGNATHNISAHHTMPVTGNPIIALLAVTSLVGGYAALRRNK